jgi:hypothetical protein
MCAFCCLVGLNVSAPPPFKYLSYYTCKTGNPIGIQPCSLPLFSSISLTQFNACNITKQIGQFSGFGGCLNSSLSCNSRPQASHIPFCVESDVPFGSLLMQYLTSLHALHAFSLVSPLSCLPQLAHGYGCFF